MPTKQIKVILQAQQTGAQDVTVAVSVNGNNVFNQTVPSIGSAEQGQTNPNESFQFSLDMPTTAVPADQNMTFSFSSSNGRAKVEQITSNFSLVGIGSQLESGNADAFVGCNIVTQPEWDGVALLERYNIAYNLGPDQVTGPGEILIENGETVVFDVAVPLYSPAAWDAAVTYAANSVVSYQSTIYQSWRGGTAPIGQNPASDTRYWFTLPVPAWNSDASYNTNDRVVYQELYYRAEQNVPAGTPITDNAYWSS